ncbi:twin-arginine translocase subunit TatC [Lysinibacillus sp. NPDC097287]|uniref:twin-arginine translocase subunit TatC n=1 Tax=Lysinibacillus sp. NPDC097287 TaxID=3364144 RepID=UPI00380914FC
MELNDKELNLMDHLEELRKRLIITVVAFLIFLCATFIFVKDIYLFFTRNLDDHLIVLGPGDVMWIYFTIACIIAIAFTIPVLALQIWLFVKPALKKSEQKITLLYIPALFLLFIGGLAFGYFVIFPLVLNFLIELASGVMDISFTVEKYFKFLLNMSLPFAVLFELPIVMMFLTSLGIIDPYVMAKIRKYAYFVLIVVAVVITPPEFMSDFIVTVPMLLLYEISISLSKIVYKRKLKKAKAIEDFS